MDEIVIADDAYQIRFDEFKKDYPRVQPRSTKGIRDYSRFKRQAKRALGYCQFSNKNQKLFQRFLSL
jgi:hypothetical protein